MHLLTCIGFCWVNLTCYLGVQIVHSHLFKHLLTCIGFCSVNLTSYRRWRKFLSRDVYYCFFTLQCEQGPYSTLLLLLTYNLFSHHIVHAHLFKHLLTCIGFCSVNLTSYRRWRKFLSRDVYYRFFTLQCEQGPYSTLLLLLTYK